MAEVVISNAPIPEKFEIEEEIGKFLKKFEERWKITSFKLDVDVHSPAGRKKYSMHAKIKASDETFVVKAVGWDIPSTIKLLLDGLGRKIGKGLKKKRKKGIELSRRLKIKENEKFSLA